MSQPSLKEYIPRLRSRYARLTGKQARSRLLDEFCALSGWERKDASKVLRGVRRDGRGSGRVERRGVTAERNGSAGALLAAHGAALRQADGGDAAICVGQMENLEAGVGEKLLAMSAATIDRLLARVKQGRRQEPLAPRSDSAIKALVEIRAERWATREVGWTELDAVAHCAGHGREFPVVVDQRGDYSGWTEVRCVWMVFRFTLSLSGDRYATRAD